MPPQPTEGTSTSGDAATDLPQTTKDKTATWSVCKMLVCGTESNPSSKDSCACREALAQRSISPWMLFWWEGCRKASQPPLESGCGIESTQQGLDRETTLLTFENSPPSLHPQNLPEAGTGIAGTWRNLHVHQPETGSTYPHHCMCHYRTNDSWPPATFKRRGLFLGTNLMVQDIASTRSA